MAAKAAESAEILNKLFNVDEYPVLKLFFVVIDGSNLYNLGYLGLAIAAKYNIQFYPILLLDIVKQSDDL